METMYTGIIYFIKGHTVHKDNDSSGPHKVNRLTQVHKGLQSNSFLYSQCTCCVPFSFVYSPIPPPPSHHSTRLQSMAVDAVDSSELHPHTFQERK